MITLKSFSSEMLKSAMLIGSQMPDSLALQVLYEYCAGSSDTEGHLTDLEDGEILLAFKKFANKELDYKPDFTGLISGLLITDVIKSYRDWWTEKNKVVNYAYEWQKPMTAIGDTNLEQRNKQAALDAFERFKKNPNCLMPSCHYDTLDELGLMKFTPQEKRDMMEEAMTSEKSTLITRREGTQSLTERRSLENRITALLPKDCISVAKTIALLSYFRSLEIEGIELSDEINKAKAA